MDIRKSTLIELKRQDSDFNGFRWIAKITNSGARRLNLYKVLKIEKTVTIATDGHRLHIYYFQNKLPIGVYTILINNQNQILLERQKKGTYPLWKFLIPSKSEKEKMTKIAVNTVGPSSFTAIVRQMHEKSCIEFKYFMDLGFEIFKAYISDKAKDPVFLENFDQSKQAAIMPMYM